MWATPQTFEHWSLRKWVWPLCTLHPFPARSTSATGWSTDPEFLALVVLVHKMPVSGNARMDMCWIMTRIFLAPLKCSSQGLRKFLFLTHLKVCGTQDCAQYQVVVEEGRWGPCYEGLLSFQGWSDSQRTIGTKTVACQGLWRSKVSSWEGERMR